MFNGRNGASNGSADHLVEDATRNAHEMGRELHHHAENAKSDMVKTLYAAAKNLRKEVRDADIDHEVVERVDDVATGFEKAAGYLKQHSYGDMSEDAVKTVKRYPLQILAVIFVIGVIAGLILRGSQPSSKR